MLNVARDSMAHIGFSPATRVFEAAGAGACLITDAWEGIEMFLTPDEEVLGRSPVWASHALAALSRSRYFAGVADSLLIVAGVAVHEHRTQPPYGALLASPLLRGGLLLDMVVGVFVLWRLIPRIDAHRIRPASACMAVAAVMAVAFGAATALLG